MKKHMKKPYAGVIHKCRKCGKNHKTRAHEKKTGRRR